MMIKKYTEQCKKCIDGKANVGECIDWCTFPEYCDIHLKNGSVFVDVVQLSCNTSYSRLPEDIEFEFYQNKYDEEGRRYIVRMGDIIAVVERHIKD